MMPQQQPINWDSPEEAFITTSMDIRHLFDTSDLWYLCVRSERVRIVPERILHIMEGERDGRLEIFRRRPDLLYLALEYPEVIEAKPRYWDKIGHYSMTYLVRLDDDSEHPNRYVAVAINLANPPGEPEAEYHYVRTCYVIEYRNVFKASGEIRQRWKLAKEKPASAGLK